MPSPRSEDWMQAVAAEMNLAETSFVVPREEGYSLRWFTPTTEVEICGHATIAASHALWSTGVLQRDQEAVYHTLSGVLTAKCEGDWIYLDFPALPAAAVESPIHLMQGLGISGKEVYRSLYDYLVVLNSEAQVANIDPNISLLSKVDCRGVIVTGPSSNPDFDFVSRFFAPNAGVPEDPATGSSHCTLAPYWFGRLGKSRMIGHQISTRGGVVRVRHLGDRVELGGQAVTVIKGFLV